MGQHSLPAFVEPGCRDAVEVVHVGVEREPIVILDHATRTADALVDFAARTSRFVPAGSVGSGYPGLLGDAPASYIDSLVRLSLPLIADHIVGGPVRPVRARGNFSLVTTAPVDLTADQRMPHVDAADRMQFAAVHYLSRTDRDGTSFFRHRATGFETIDPERLPAYRQAIDVEALAAAPAYPVGDDPAFAMIGKVEAAYDRLIVYRAALLHSGSISRIAADAADPKRGRLTGNLFLRCRRA